MIPDPSLPQGPAIDEETGRLAMPMFIIRTVADIEAPTAEEVKDVTFIGWMKPENDE